MGLFAYLTLESMSDLLLAELEDLYDVEQQLTRALPKMAEAAANDHLKQAFHDHLHETAHHIVRLEQVFGLLGQSPMSRASDAMKALIAGADEIISAIAEDEVRDAALIAAAQRVEHYEIAAYGSARTFAERLGRPDMAALLQQTLGEEYAADQRLTHIAETSVNRIAALC
jgi:ferritin-like metal-binding protein YciE